VCSHDRHIIGIKVCKVTLVNTMKAYKGSRSMVLFPWGVGHVASCLLSKLVGLLHEVIYVGGP